MNRTNTLKLFFEDYRARLNKLLDQVDINELEKVIDIMVKTFKNGNTLYVCGNGGSAANCIAYTADFSFFVRYFTRSSDQRSGR